MALLKKENIEKIEKIRNTVHQSVQATYTTFDKSGEKYFQIDTYGSSDRKMPEKISQSIQMDREMAIFLIELLKKEFDL